MKILRASTAHIADAQLLLHEYYEAVGVVKRDTPEEMQAFLSEESGGPPASFWIAYVEQVPAGCVVLRLLPSMHQAAECKRLYARPRFRGQGMADSLLDVMEEHALATGLAWVYLDSKDDLQDALRIYLRRGYLECERYNDNPQATIFLRKHLKPPSAS